MPDFLKGWAMLTSGTPFSRVASADGIQSTTTSAPPPAITWLGVDVRPARLDRDVEPGVLVEALVLGHVVAGELRLGHPFELQGRACRPPAPPQPTATTRCRRQSRPASVFVITCLPSLFHDCF